MLTYSTPVAPLGKRQLMLLGRLLVSRRPDVASELLGQLDSAEAAEQDLSRMPAYFGLFCRLYGRDPEDFRGALFKGKKSDQRKVFIACMLHLYSPATYLQPTEVIQIGLPLVTSGFVARLSDTLRVDKGSLSRTFRQVILWERVEEEFRAEVHQTIQQLKTVQHGPGD